MRSVALSIGLMALSFVSLRKSRRFRITACSKCGYSLVGHGLPAKCPECGWGNTEEAIWRGIVRNWRWRRAGAIAWVAACCFGFRAVDDHVGVLFPFKETVTKNWRFSWPASQKYEACEFQDVDSKVVWPLTHYESASQPLLRIQVVLETPPRPGSTRSQELLWDASDALGRITALFRESGIGVDSEPVRKELEFLAQRVQEGRTAMRSSYLGGPFNKAYRGSVYCPGVIVLRELTWQRRVLAIIMLTCAAVGGWRFRPAHASPWRSASTPRGAGGESAAQKSDDGRKRA